MNLKNFLLLLFIIGLLIANAAYASQDDIKETIAIFPFENFSEDSKALEVIIPRLKSRLEAKGYTVLEENDMNAFLLKERIRTSGYVSKDTAMKIGDELKVKAILTGSVNSFGGKDNPHAGFTAYLVDASDGSLAWANHAAATGEDFEKILGLGRINTLDRLSDRVLDALLKSFKTTSPEKHSESLYKIAVMPFQNKSKTRDAGIMVTYMFIVELFKNKNFVPVEYGEVRRLIIDLRLREKGEIDLKSTEAVAGSAGVDGIVVGSVGGYREGSGITDPPEVEISARLINARQGKILWYNSSTVKGDDSVIILDWGRILSAENIAYKAIAKLVKEMGKVKWH